MGDREGGDNGIAIGIDLGTSYSCVAVWRGGRRVEVIPNDHGNLHTRSYVAFTRTQRLLGDDAFAQAYNNAPNTVFCAKRFIGHKINEIIQSDMDHWPFRVEQGVARKPRIVVNYKGEEIFFSAEEILSMILIKMKRIAEAFVGSTVKDAVISVPAHFNNLQRKAMRDAGEIAGLNVMQIINEPAAAAIAYGFTSCRDMNKLRKVLIFDFGGGALDVSLLELWQGRYKVIATAGDPHLGGEDFDNRLVNHFADEFYHKTNIDILGLGQQRPLRRLRTACEKAKKILSTNTQTTIEVVSLWEDIDFSSSITREQFEDLNIDLLCNCLMPVNKCLGDAGMEKGYVDEVVLVGGSTRIPRVRQTLKEYFNRNELYMGINPDEAVACGAAIQASIISDANKNGGDFFLVDVMPHPLWFETTGKSMLEFIPKNSTIPTTKKEVFTTFVDDQEELVMNVYEGWGAQVAANKLLGTFKLRDIPPASRGVPQITVSFEINYDGILHITAVCDINGRESTITISNRTDHHSKEEMAEMVQRAKKFEKEDKELEEKMLVRVKLEDYISKMKKTIWDDDDDKKLISPDDKKKMEDAIEWTQNELVGIVELTDKLEDLKNMCDPIIDRMHQKSLPKAHDPNLTEELQEQAVARSELEYFYKEMKKHMEDDEISSILGVDDKEKIEDTLEQSFRWLEHNELAGTDELKAKLKEVQDICDPIIQRAYGEGYE